MTWDPTKPANNQSPSLAPEQIRDNWSRLQSMITGDHLFNTVVPAPNTDGYHKISHCVTQAGIIGDGAPAPAAGVGQLYTKSITTTGVVASTAGAGEHLCYQRGTGGGALQEASLSACPVRAAVNFTGSTSSGPFPVLCTTNWAYNVDKVEKTSNGTYKISFPAASKMPSIHYVPLISSNSGASSRVQQQLKLGAFTEGSFSVEFFKNSDHVNPTIATCVVFGG